MKALPYERATGAGAGEEIELARFVASDAPAVVPAALPTTLRAIQALATPAVRQTLRLGERMVHQEWQFTINGEMFPNVPPIDATLGTRQLWTVKNESDMDHPFHVHGFFFQRSAAPQGPEWKDTINIAARSTVDLIVDFAPRPGAAGDWMYHCHILEHAERGMMGDVRAR